MTQDAPVHIKTITEYHRLLGLPKPQHSLISLTRFEDMIYNPQQAPKVLIHHFYSIALKKSTYAKLKYGQLAVDFEEGTMLFMAPRQVLTIEWPQESATVHSGWLLLVHPDLLWNTHLSRKIRHYDYFGYQANEALHLSESEEQLIMGLLQQIAQEYSSRIDHLSQNVLIAQLDLLLTYAERFYQRQFITRQAGNHQFLSRLEELINAYVNDNRLAVEGVPPVTYFANALHVSPNYLSRLLKNLTGQTTKPFILDKIIELAKEKLSTTDLSMNEIAYSLGFEHPQSFTKVFKAKTHLTPTAFRASFN